MQRDLLRLVELIDTAEAIASALSEIDFSRFEEDELLHDGILWRLMKVGEAAYQLSDELRERYPEVEWHRAIGFRNRIVHGYFDLDLELIYRTAVENVPVLLAEATRVLHAEFPTYGEDR